MKISKLQLEFIASQACSEFSKLRDYSMEIVKTETVLRLVFFCFFETETFRDCKFSNLSRPRLSRDCNLGFFETETFRDSAKVVETETFLRLSLISAIKAI